MDNSKKTTLYEIADSISYALFQLEDSEESFEELQEELDSLDMAFEEKADNIARILAELKGQEAAVKTEIDRLQKRKKSLERNSDWLKSYLANAMQVTGKKKFKTDLFNFGLRNNKRIEIPDEESFMTAHPEYVDVQEVKKIRKIDVKNDILKNGVVLDDAFITTNITPSIR